MKEKRSVKKIAPPMSTITTSGMKLSGCAPSAAKRELTVVTGSKKSTA